MTNFGAGFFGRRGRSSSIGSWRYGTLEPGQMATMMLMEPLPQENSVKPCQNLGKKSDQSENMIKSPSNLHSSSFFIILPRMVR